ncbi:OB-fold domain-containing protein [Sphingomonas sp. MG17]|uniref:OB-fold domain-containing protein n=1 Tax=Sphingomonas tagetis TaxID=2949092 RepID=A0A9X2KL67_9SPHN|nr:OB-fold domain-containing protein [Sphingomonas tagetis]MCP3731259.1 OB-fold domain-containing protein [Sphingomonas tagetis]
MPIQPDLEWHQHLAEGRFMLCADAATGVPFYPPRAIVPGKGSEDVVWIPASGRGTVYSSTTVYKRLPETNYNVALVDLAEGPRMMSRIEGIDPADVVIGMAVTARIEWPEGGDPFVVFVPAEGAE